MMEVIETMPTRLLDLPSETIIQILTFLDFADIISISRVNGFLRSCVQTSQFLQYRFTSQIAAVADNTLCNLSVKERFGLLATRENGWSRFNVDFRKTLPILHQPYGIYDLTSGIYLMGDVNQKALHYCRLPSRPEDTLTWNRIDLDTALTVVDVGLSLYEHDLVAVVTTKQTPMSNFLLEVEVHLLQFSTGKPHPLAKNSTLFVRKTHHPAASAVGIEVVGEYLALVTTPNSSEHAARFCVFEWRTGAVVLDYPVTHGTYCSIIFISPTHILLANALAGSLDVFVIPPREVRTAEGFNSQVIRPLVRLGLPMIHRGYTIRAIYGRAEPNPAPTGIPHSTSPFHPAPEDAISIFNMHIRSDGDHTQWGDFSMFVHRSALLRLCEKYMPLLALGQVDRQATVCVSWELWGPPVTRWIDAAVVPWWITTSTGQRCVLSITPEALEAGAPPFVTILDFNSITVKRTLAAYAAKVQREVEGVPNVYVHPSRMAHGVFVEAVESSLPYVSIARHVVAEEDFEFDGVLMDEERLLGLVTDEEGRVRKIEIFHIGDDNH